MHPLDRVITGLEENAKMDKRETRFVVCRSEQQRQELVEKHDENDILILLNVYEFE